MASERELSEAFERLERGSSLREEAKKLDIGKSTVERHFQDYLERRTSALRSGLAELTNETSKAEKKLAELGEKYEKRRQEEEAKLREALAKRERENELRIERIDAELEAKKKLLPECARQGMSFKECLDAVKKIGNLGVEFSRRKRLLKQWGEAISEKQKQHNSLERQVPELEESARYLRCEAGNAQELYWDMVAKIQFLSRQLPLLEQGNREQLNIVLALQDETWKLRAESGKLSADAEEMKRLKKEDASRLAEIRKNLEVAQEELNRVKMAKDEALARAKTWARETVEQSGRKANEELRRLNEAVEVSRIQLAALGIQLTEMIGEVSKKPEGVRLHVKDATGKIVNRVIAKPVEAR